jgi:hypothetical protein
LVAIGPADSTPTDRPASTFNHEVARQFRLAADLLEAQDADHFRVNAYRRAASTVEAMEESVGDVYRHGGLDALVALPTIGRGFAVAIADLFDDGRWSWLERLQGEVDPEAVLATVAGIGAGLAARIHGELGIETLEELEMAAHDGRLASVDGFGPKRVRAVSDSLAGRLRRRGVVGGVGRATAADGGRRPSTDELLDVDRDYRSKVDQGGLPTVAPRRFNPDHESWLPILHTRRGDRHYTVLFSNTARAHELGRTRDWVVIYADGPDGGQWTVVTETKGPLEGNRVVRGREADCLALVATRP